MRAGTRQETSASSDPIRSGLARFQARGSQAGAASRGVIPGQNVSVIAVQWHGADALELTYKTADGDLGQRCLPQGRGEARDRPRRGAALRRARRGLQAGRRGQRITLAGLFDPMLAVATSDVQPLPHQIRAVYGELLPRTPLRFLLADDPGAGKTIMAGLYIKELLLRDDVQAVPDRRPGRAGGAVAGRAVLQVRAARSTS